MRARSISLTFVLALAATTGCGDPVRVPGYEGSPVFVLHARIPVALVRGMMPLVLRLENDPQSRTEIHSIPLPLDERRELHLALRGPMAPGPATPFALSRRDRSQNPVKVMRISAGDGLVASSVHDFLVYAGGAAADLELLEPGGPTIAVEPGYQLIRRSCLADGRVTLERLAPDTVVDLELQTEGPGPDFRREERVLAGCGITDLRASGKRIELPGGRPVGLDDPPFAVNALAFGPDGQLFTMVGPAGVGTSIGVLDATAAMPRMTPVVNGHRFDPFLAVGGDGAFLFTRSRYTVTRFRLPPPGGGAEPVNTSLLDLFGAAVISPDGRRIATIAGTSTENSHGVIRSFDSGEEIGLSEFPIAWSPDSTSLLVSAGPRGGSIEQLLAGPLAILGPDRTLRNVRPLPAAPPLGDGVAAFWNERGPFLVASNFSDGIRGANLESGEQATFLHPDQGRSNPIRVIAAAGAVFLWSRLCPGFGQQVCNTRLIRVALADGAREALATAIEPYPFAVSPDGRRLAVAVGGTVWLRDL